MKRWMVVTGVMIAVLRAVESPAQFQQVDEVLVRPGGEARYEALLARLREAAAAVDHDQSWLAFEVVSGLPGARFRIVRTFSSWSEREPWLDGRELLTKAFGPDVAEQAWAEGHSVVESQESQVWQALPDSGSNPRAEPFPFYEVYVREVRAGTEREVRDLHREFKKAYDVATSRPSVSRSVLWLGRNQGLVFRRLSGFDSWSELDNAESRGILGKHFGPEATRDMVDTVRAAAVWTDHFVVALRRELSYSPEP